MSRIPLYQRVLLWLCLTLALGVVLTPLAEAAWSGSGSGTATALADTMPSGNRPSAAGSSSNVTLRWPAAVFPGGGSVAGYVIRRFNAANGAEATVGAGCSGTVTTTTCTEASVPSGAWIYTDTPVQHTWSGAQSTASAVVTLP